MTLEMVKSELTRSTAYNVHGNVVEMGSTGNTNDFWVAINVRDVRGTSNVIVLWAAATVHAVTESTDIGFKHFVVGSMDSF